MRDAFHRRLIKRFIIATLIVALIATVIILLNFDINKRVARIEEHKREIAMQNEAIIILSGLKQEAQKVRQYQDTLASLLPNRDQLISFPRELEKLAKQYEIDLGFAFGNETPSTESQPGVIRFTLSLGGSMNGMLDFLKAFEAHKYYLNLSSVDLSKKEGGRFSLVTGGEIYTR